MKRDIQTHIDRTVGTEGILRIPSWWMHKILSDLVQYCDSLESSDAGIKEYLESQLNLVGDAVEALDARVTKVESHELFAIVSELPSEPKENTIYLIPSANGEGNNILTEWVYINDAWEQFGEFKADVDLSGYVKKEDIAELQQNKEDKKNKVTSLSDESTDVQYPSAKTVYDLIKQLKERIEEQDQFIEDLQNTKIDRENDDYYPKMAVGLADNLAGVDVVDSEINFRRSGGGAISDGVARIESIKGNSVVWNQLAKEINATNWSVYNSTFASQTFSNGEINVAVQDITLTGYRVGITLKASQPLVIGHIYLAVGEIKCAVPCRFTIEVKKSSVTFGEVATTWTPLSVFVTSDQASTRCIISPQGTFTESANTYSVRGVRLFDLTKMFGAGNEPTTIEEFYQRIPMGVDLNAYNEGEVIHMDVQSIESVGVNQWDEEWVGGYYSNGNFTSSQNYVASKNPIKVIAGQQYFFSTKSINTFYVTHYDENLNYIGNLSGLDVYGRKVVGKNAVYTIPQGVTYIKIFLSNNYGSIYNHDICINISDASINGEYFPYIKRVEDLSIIRKYFPEKMKSAGSAHDEIRYNKESGKWEYSKGRLKSVDMGTLNWRSVSSSGGGQRFRASLTGLRFVSSAAEKGNLLCKKYDSVTADDTWRNTKGIAVEVSDGISLSDSTYTDAAALKASLQGVILYYEAAEWEWVELDEADQFKDLDYQVWNAGTEKAIAEGKSAPLAADISYGFNAIGKIKELEQAIKALQTTVASL